MQDLTVAAGSAWTVLERRAVPAAGPVETATSPRDAEDARFNPYHAPAGAGGGEFTTAGGAGGGSKKAAKAAPKAKTAPKAAAKPKAVKRLPAVQPNGLGYTDAQWRQLQQLEADARAGKKLTAHQKHMLHVAHEKREAALAEAEAKQAARPSAPKAAVKAPVKKASAPKKASARTPAQVFAGHPVKGV